VSNHITSLVWEIPFPTPTQKLLMLRIADYSDDDGGGIYPSIEHLSRQTGSKQRQTQYALRALEKCELLSKITQGGTGPKKTNTWHINVELLLKLAFQELVLEGKHDTLRAVENKGAIFAPPTLKRVQSAALRVQSATDKGATHCTQSLGILSKDPKACADARDEPRSAPVEKVRAKFEITERDPQWSKWISEIQSSGRDDLLEAAKQNKSIQVSSRWPSEGLQGLISAGPINFTDRMLGEQS